MGRNHGAGEEAAELKHMGRRAKAVITAILIILIFAFAPWLNDREIHDRVLKEKGRLDHTIDEDGRLICDYKVNWAPFGRWVASCEGGWYVTFWGQIV